MFYAWSGWCLLAVVALTVSRAVRQVIEGETITKRQLALRNLVVGVWIAWFIAKSINLL
jgi:hypothetical protein